MPGTCSGQVLRWDDDEGWGVLANDEVPGTVFAHFAHIQMDGYRSLTPGQRVEFAYEPGRGPGQLRPRRHLGQALPDRSDQPRHDGQATAAARHQIIRMCALEGHATSRHTWHAEWRRRGQFHGQVVALRIGISAGAAGIVAGGCRSGGGQAPVAGYGPWSFAGAPRSAVLMAMRRGLTLQGTCG